MGLRHAAIVFLTYLIALDPWVAQARQLGAPVIGSGIQLDTPSPQEDQPDPPDPPDPPEPEDDPEEQFTGDEISVCASGCDFSNFQSAINAAACEDIIRLEMGETFTGNFQLPDKNSGMECQILITTSETTGMLPPHGSRLCPEDINIDSTCEANTDPDLLPTIRATQSSSVENIPAIRVMESANGWMLRRLRFTNGHDGQGTVVAVGQNTAADQPTRADQPDNITIDQVYVDLNEHPYRGQARVFQLHGKTITVKNSMVLGANRTGADGQVVWIINGEGPYLVRNNFFQGGTETVLLGGDTPHIKTYATVSGNASTTGADFTWTAGADCPFVGQTIAPSDGTTRYHAVVATVSNCTSASASVTWSPAIAMTPTSARWGVVPGDCANMPSPCDQGVTIEYNQIQKNPAERDQFEIVPAPQGVTLTADDDGSLTAGTYSVQIVGRTVASGGTISGAASTATQVVVGDGGAIDWSVTSIHADVTTYRLVVTHPDATVHIQDFAATSGSYTTTGSVGTLPTAARWQHKNLLQLKMCVDCLIRYNDMAHVWKASAGTGVCIWNKTVNQNLTVNGNAPWGENTNTVMEYNVCRSAPGYMVVSGNEYENNDADYRTAGTTGFIFRNNLGYDLSNTIHVGEGQNGSGIDAFFYSNACVSCSFVHNTIDYSGNTFTFEIDGSAARNKFLSGGFALDNNLLTRRNTSGGGPKAPNLTEGIASISSEIEGVGPGGTYTMTGNVWGNSVSGPAAGRYDNQGEDDPIGNLFITYTAWQALFVGAGSDTVEGYRLIENSEYATAATDGTPVGVQSMQLMIDELAQTMGGNPVPLPEDPDTPPGTTQSIFYLSATAPNISPTASASWNTTSSTDRWVLSPLPIGTNFTLSVSPSGTSTNPEYHLITQLIGPAMSAQTIDGTVQCMVLARMNNTGHDATLAIGIRVVSNDGTTVRGTLLAVVGNNTLGTPYEFHASGSAYRPRGCYSAADATPITLSSVSALDGDRLVVELGCKDHSALASGQNCTLVGGDSAATDLPLVGDMEFAPDVSVGLSVGNPTIVFSDSIVLQP